MQDEFYLYPFNTAFADSLDELNLNYEFQSLNGGHINQLTTRFPISFRFIDSVMNQIPSSSEEFTNQPETFSLFQNYPNPFNPGTKIKYQIPASLNPSQGGTLVTLKVFDILGSEVATLVNEEKPAGTYELTWNAVNLPSGVYFYQLRAGAFVSTKKMILTK
jgi:hypothetical protein